MSPLQHDPQQELGRTHRLLQESEDRLSLLVRATNAAIWDWDLVNDTVWWNDEYDKLFGPRPTGSVAWQWWEERIHEDDRRSVSQSKTSALSGDANEWFCEYRFRCRDGRFANIRDWGHIGRNDLGEAIRLVGSTLDVSDLKDTQTAHDGAKQELEQRRVEVAHVSRLNTMGALVAGLAHELNQPLNAIVNYARGFARRAPREAVLSDELLAAVDQIVREAERAANVIRGMRRLVFRRNSLQDSVEIELLVRNAMDLCLAEARKTGVEIRFSLPESLPHVLVDCVQIEQVILALLVNAIESISCLDQRWVEITASQYSQELVRVTVRDSGQGVAPQSVKEVFEPFFTTKEGGLGMGLAVCQSIVEHHGGTIWCESPVGNGAEFSFTIPVVPA